VNGSRTYKGLFGAESAEHAEGKKFKRQKKSMPLFPRVGFDAPPKPRIFIFDFAI
jgi:hypothetical protein